MNLGSLKHYPQNTDTPYTGAIACALLRSEFKLVKAAKQSDDSPDYDIIDSVSGFERGAAWLKTGNNGEFLSMSFDGPDMDKPLHVAAFRNKQDNTKLEIVWNRPRQQGKTGA